MVASTPSWYPDVTSNESLRSGDAEPNAELIRPTGWMVKAVYGNYCVAWRGPDEIVLYWHAGGWVRVAGRGEFGAMG
jgi:hypothetical protein